MFIVFQTLMGVSRGRLFEYALLASGDFGCLCGLHTCEA